ncbi:S-layer homology domain-containing protein [Halobacillus locisalis]|uniref:S-layer homology domain-containing protein n=1 Tax=Halobacillus locisalis TaxID=220753 RepID=A0A838CSU0_9BACI|nr:S-layer homology domain-containing protein [Halobacillus locisalis]MBA2175021.1 S-layer homology domain-containing protein [Halobacillus locisalis]
MKKRLSVTVIWFMTLILLLPTTSWAEDEKVDYIALGDSLAVGITPESSPENLPENGYSDLLAHHFDELGKLSSYDKSFAYPGYTSDNVLNDLKDNKQNEAGESIQTKVSEAEVITISAGANDVLKALNINAETAEADVDIEKFQQTLKQVGINLSSLSVQIKQLNPDASIYLMGYYNPFPRLPEDQKTKLYLALLQFNRVIEDVANSVDASFVSVKEAMEKDDLTYLPDPTDIHPNEEGYEVLANEFFEEITLQSPSEFNDVPDNHFAKDSIDYLTSKAIISGYGDGTYKPDQNVTRGEASLMINRSIVFDRHPPENPEFADVIPTTSTYEAIARLKQEEIIDGFGDGSFYPDQPLTRDQMAKIVVNAFNLESQSTDVEFSDVDEEGWAYPYIQVLAENEVTVGYGDGTFRPKEEVTREQLAAFLERSMQIEE